MNQRKKTLILVQKSIFIGLIAVLQLLGSLLTYFSVLPFSISLVLIPIIVGGIFYGKRFGATLGASFGIMTYILAMVGLDVGGHMLFQANPFLLLLLCLTKAILCAVLPLLFYEKTKLQNQNAIVVIVSALTCICNTTIFIALMFLCYRPILYSWAGNTNILTYILVGIVGVNFIIELISAVVISPVLVKRLKSVIK